MKIADFRLSEASGESPDNSTAIHLAYPAPLLASVVGLEQVRLSQTNGSTFAFDFLSLTFTNVAKPFGFFADGWVTGSTTAPSVP